VCLGFLSLLLLLLLLLPQGAPVDALDRVQYEHMSQLVQKAQQRCWLFGEDRTSTVGGSTTLLLSLGAWSGSPWVRVAP
jgi:hypothetical protein